MKIALFVVLGAVTLWFVGSWALLVRRGGAGQPVRDGHTWYHLAVGFVFGFLDTFGVGNFAPTTSAFKLRGTVPDEKIPGTLNVGYVLPTVAQAYFFIYVFAFEVEEWTLTLMILAAVLGAWLGAGFVARWPRRRIQIGMGVALLAAAGLMILKQLGRFPAGSDSIGLSGVRLWIGLAGNFALGALMTLGIGLYAPCLILVSLLGMSERTAFPIMMGSCALLMPVAGVRFVRTGRYSLSTSLALTCAAIPAVFIAVYNLKKMTVDQIRWLVVAVVLYTAVMMLRSAFRERRVSVEGVTPTAVPAPAADVTG